MARRGRAVALGLTGAALAALLVLAPPSPSLPPLAGTADIPPVMLHAVEATFWRDQALYAYAARLTLWRPDQGTSPNRHLAVAAKALLLWLFHPRDEVLAHVVEHIYYMPPARGFAGVAERCFGKPPAALDAAESATLAAFTISPQLRTGDPARLLERRNRILARMQANGALDAGAAGQAIDSPLDPCADPTARP